MLTAVNSAVTNDNGVVDYSWNVPEALAAAQKNNEDVDQIPIDLATIAYDLTLKYPLSTIARMPAEIRVPANSEALAKITIEMPEAAIPGVIAGGVYLTQKEEQEPNAKDNQGVQIKNKFVYVVGVQLRQKADISKILPELVLDKNKILPKQVNYRNHLGVNLQNTQPVYIRDLLVEAKISRKGRSEIIHETNQQGMKMAPNSNFNYGINWDNQEFKAGTYRLQLKARAEDYDQEWFWDEEFKIDAALAAQLNEQAVELEKSSNLLYYLIGGALLLIILLAVAYYITRRRQAPKKRRKKSRKRKVKKTKLDH